MAGPDPMIFWRAKQFSALWHFNEGLFLFLINYFSEKEGFLISCIVYIK
jgi:hypothetical protein